MFGIRRTIPIMDRVWLYSIFFFLYKKSENRNEAIVTSPISMYSPGVIKNTVFG